MAGHKRKSRSSTAAKDEDIELESADHAPDGDNERYVQSQPDVESVVEVEDVSDFEDAQHFENGGYGGESSSSEEEYAISEPIRAEIAKEFLKEHTDRKRLLKEFSTFVPWILVFILIIFLSRDITQVYYNELAIRDIFLFEEYEENDSHIYKSYQDIMSMEELWQWLEGPFLNAFNEDSWYNGEEFTDDEDNYILRYNRVVGSVRLRQLRVGNLSCGLSRTIDDDFHSCYGSYGASTKSMESFRNSSLEGFEYSDTASPVYWGSQAFYDGGGFIVELGENYTESAAKLAVLKENLWLDKQTRALLINLNTINPSNNHFTSSLFMIELHPGGSFIISANLRSFPISLYLSGVDIFRLVLEILWLIVLGCMLIYVGLQIWTSRHLFGGLRKAVFSWFVNPWWNMLDAVNTFVFVIGVIEYLRFYWNLKELKDGIDYDRFDKYVGEEFESVGNQYIQMYNLVAVNILISMFKFFKYFNLNPRLALLGNTIFNASGDLAINLLYFFLLFMSFVLMSWLVFGTVVADFRAFNHSFFTCFKMLLGDFDWKALYEANRILAPVFFILYMVAVFFIVINLFLAIVNESFITEKKNAEGRTTLKRLLRKKMKSGWKSVKGKVKREPAAKRLPLRKGKLLRRLGRIDRQSEWENLDQLAGAINCTPVEANWLWKNLVDHSKEKKRRDEVRSELNQVFDRMEKMEQMLSSLQNHLGVAPDPFQE